MADRNQAERFKYEYLDRHVEEAQEERRTKRQQERQKKLAAQKSPQERARIARKHRFFWAGVLICTVLIIFAARTVDTLAGLQEQKIQAQQQLDTLVKQRDQLESELKEVQSDEYVEQEARSELRMIYPGEVLYVAPDDQIRRGIEKMKENEEESGKEQEESKPENGKDKD